MISFLDWKSVFMWSWIHSKARFQFLFLLRKQEIRSVGIYIMYLYIRSSVSKVGKFLLSKSWSLSFNPFNCYNIVSCFIRTCFSQVLFEWCWLESILKKFPTFYSSFLELKDERIRMPPLCIRILLHSIRMLLSASGYPIYSSSIFRDFLRDFDSISFWFVA